MKQFWKLATVAFAVGALSPAAQAQTIDFNAHAPDYNTPIFDSGYQFDVTANGWGVFQNSDGACCNINDNGTRALFADGDRNGGNATILMTLVGGGTFGVSAIDASVYFQGAPNEQITLLGNLFGGGTVSTVLSTSTTWTTFALSGFQNLTSLRFTANTPGGFLSAPGMGIDNIVLGAGAETGVPEPATWALMIVGFGMVGGAMRRRRTDVAFRIA